MREQKYARVLEEYEEQLKSKEDTLEEVEDEVSMTREIKYKDLQEVIDKESEEDKSLKEDEESEEKEEQEQNEAEQSDEDEVTSKIDALKKDIAEVEDILEQTNHLEALEKMEKEQEDSSKESLEVEEDKEVSKNEDVKIEQISGKSDLDDIYLTRSFQPFRKRFRARSILIFFLKLIVTIAFLGAIGYFIVYPIVNFYLMSRPEKVFDNTIDYVSEQIIDNRDTDILDNNIYFNINSDKMIIQMLNGLNVSIDAKELKVNNKETDNIYQIDLDGNNVYYKKINRDEVKKNEIELSDADYKYVVNKTAEILKELVVKDKLSRTKDEMLVNGKKVNVYRNTFTIDQKTAISITKQYYEEIGKDSKLVDYYAKCNKMSLSEYQDYLKNVPVTYDKEFNAAVNIYTTNKGKVVGLDFENNGFRTFYLYTNNDDFNMYLTSADVSDCGKDNNCVTKGLVLEVDGTKKDDKININVKYNNKELTNSVLDSIKIFS